MAVETLDQAIIRHLKLRLGRMTNDYGSGSRACLASEDIRVEDVAGQADLFPTSGRPVAMLVQRDTQQTDIGAYTSLGQQVVVGGGEKIYRRYFASDGTLVEVKAVARITQIYSVEFQATIDDKALGRYGRELIRCLVLPRRFAYHVLDLETALGGTEEVFEAVGVNVGNAQRRALERYRPTGEQDPMGQALYVVEQVGAMWTADVEFRTHIIEASSQKAMAGAVVTAMEVESGT